MPLAVAPGSRPAGFANVLSLPTESRARVGIVGALVIDGPGDDIFITEVGPNGELAGGAGNDLLIAGTGRDRLTGGAGADTFEFGRAEGKNRITDFDTALDTIRITGGARRFEALTITEDGADAVVSFGRTEVRLLGIDAATLDASVFDFV